MHTTTQQKLTLFGNHFGHAYCEVATELKGHRFLDKYELSLDRNKDIYFRPKVRGEDCIEKFEEMYHMFKPILPDFEKYDLNKDKPNSNETEQMDLEKSQTSVERKRLEDLDL